MTIDPIVVDTRPWGCWELLLDESYCKVKRIIVEPQQRLSYQKHQHREELWTIVQGIATVTISDVVTVHKEGDVIHIPQQAPHRVANMHHVALIFIEIQRGHYFGEDDIIRIEDDYGRTQEA